MRLFFLEAGQPLTKRFWLNENGQLEKDPYPFVKKFASHEENVTTLEEFEAALKDHASLNRCLIKGELSKRLLWESRAGTTQPLTLTEWMVIDLDDLIGFDNADDFIHQVLPAEFHDVSYILQHSASAGFNTRGIRAHIYFLLAAPTQPDQIKHWMTRLNLETSAVSRNLQLSVNGFTMKYPVDITVNQNDKLIYIAPPTLGPGIEDPLTGMRIQRIHRTRGKVDFDFPVGDFAALQAQVDDRVMELRAEGGLARRKPRYKFIGEHRVLLNPGTAFVSGERIARGFTYLNLNGGDSWGYYFQTDNPKLLYNFKGEPAVIIRDFLPDYYTQLQDRMQPGQRETPLVFRDPKTDVYYNGLYDPITERVEFLYQCGARDRLADFLAHYNQELPEPIPDWTYEFRPHDETIVDFERRFINRWQPSDVYRHAQPTDDLPPIVERVLRSVVGDDQECYEHLLNWLACLVQIRVKIGTAWILQGVEGTGKGLLVNEVMRPIIGEDCCSTKLLNDFDDRFNAELESCLLMNIDEARISDVGSTSRTTNILKNLITDIRIRVRGMRQNAREIDNYTNFIFCSNNYDAMSVSPTDRRFNVAPRQEQKLEMTEAQVAELRGQVPQFAGYLKAYAADIDLARTVLNNEAKEAMRMASQDTTEQFAAALLDGDIGYFAGYGSTSRPVGSDILMHSEFSRTVNNWIKDAIAGRPSVAQVDELSVAYRYLVGSMGQGPAKFTRMLAHKNLLVKRHGNVRGVRIEWRKPSDEDAQRWLPQDGAREAA